MDERAIKRLLVMLAASLVAIMILKTMLLNTAIKVSNAAVEKKQAALAKQAAEQQALTPPASAIEVSAASATAVTMDVPAPTPAASGVSEAHN